jgi:AAA+ ATPase superfamily predicted ATPase
MTTLIARNKEISLLRQFYKSNKPEFLALYGRRRVGKTYLIREFFKNKKDVIFFNATGQKDGNLKEQAANFTQQINKTFLGKLQVKSGKNWNEVFETLTNAIEQSLKNRKIILFLDELPWMATRNSRLLQTLDYYWNQHWSNDKRIKLIICGSSASWIIHKIIKNKGGLHNRITEKICLKTFNLSETKNFLEHSGIKYKNNHILLVYIITGGVPYYLSKLKKSLSVTQNIENLVFSTDAFFLGEFDNLFSSLFDDPASYIKIIREIANRRYGIGKTELLTLSDESLVGEQGIKKLDDLEESGFITSFKPHFHKRQGIYYRLTDEFTAFYLKWIEPIKKTIQESALESGYWHEIQNSAEWYSWLGYSFESVCYKHIPAIRKKLLINPTAIANTWRYVPRKNSEENGAQIDLLFDRKDDSITLCEIKYTKDPFVLTKEYKKTLEQKIEIFKTQTQTKKQLFMALISANGIKENMYSEEFLSGTVTLDDLFIS